jgi:hypothetical protein
MDEIEELLLIKEKYRSNTSFLFHEFIKDGRVREFLRKKIFENNGVDRLKVMSKETIVKYFGGGPGLFKELGLSFSELKNSRPVTVSDIDKSQLNKVWLRDFGWVSLGVPELIISGSGGKSFRFRVSLEGLEYLEIGVVNLSVYENLIENFSEKYGNFDFFEYKKIQTMSTSQGRRNLSVYDIYKSCNFSPPQICPITKEKISWNNSKSFKNNSASLDKIIPSKGYVAGNIKIISHLGNAMKSVHTIQTLKNTIEYLEDCEREKTLIS